MRHISHRRRVPMTSVLERALLVVIFRWQPTLLVATSLQPEPIAGGDFGTGLARNLFFLAWLYPISFGLTYFK